jgi:two-component system chemotaxis sensor kinase CheA
MTDHRGSPLLPADSMAAIRRVFFEECEEHLGELESGLHELQRGQATSETIDTIFRAAHSIKGGAGIFDLKPIIRLAHLFESVLDTGRQDPASLTPARVKALLKATDGLADMIRAANEGREVDEARAQALEQEVSAMVAPAETEDPFDALDFQPMAMDFTAFGEPESARGFDIMFRPTDRVYATANEPLAILRELQRLGALEVTLDETGTPLLDKLDPRASYLAWSMTLETEADASIVHDVFDFVADSSEIVVTALGGVVEEAAPMAAPDPTATEPAKLEAAAPGLAPSIRVDLERVDRLVDLVSELVINQAMLAQQVAAENLSRRSGVHSVLDELSQLTRDIQDGVMAIRAQPVRAVFQRMSRLVRETEIATGKTVRLITEGEETEVDRTVIERLTDPLTHMIRNAIDHGLESPERRAAAGKPAEGTVRLSAAHRGGRIIIEVCDDGRGIDRELVRGVAVKRGIISPDAHLTPDEIDNLIFAPGFSTASSISDLSGRGVGMDVVRRSVQALGGRITVTSEKGVGSTFILSLPLTLAVLDGMLVSVRGQSAVVPLTALVESFQVRPSDIRRIGSQSRLLTLRGVHVPLIDLGEAMGYAPCETADERAVALLVEDENGQRAALLVDAIQDQRQVVIKSLEANYRQIQGVAAATILGDGRVALILDVDAIVSAERRAGSPVAHSQAA